MEGDGVDMCDVNRDGKDDFVWYVASGSHVGWWVMYSQNGTYSPPARAEGRWIFGSHGRGRRGHVRRQPRRQRRLRLVCGQRQPCRLVGDVFSKRHLFAAGAGRRPLDIWVTWKGTAWTCATSTATAKTTSSGMWPAAAMSAGG